jgi:hypothetical protein
LSRSDDRQKPKRAKNLLKKAEGLDPELNGEDHWRAKAALAGSLLAFRKRMMDAVDTLLCHQIQGGDACGALEFRDNTGRPCLIFMALGDDAVNQFNKVMNPHEG